MDRNGYNPSIFPLGFCYICGGGGDLIRHEIFGGVANRKKSKALGLWLNLCPACHSQLHQNPSQYRWLKADAQTRAMDLWQWTEEDFISEFGKNYKEVE